jgi:nucleotide-binding universal stress UspA family protein
MITLNTDKILVPTDFSLTANKAIRHAAFLAQLNKGELMLLHVQKKAETSNLIFPVPELRLLVSLRKQLEERMEAVAAQIRSDYGIDVSCRVTEGNIISEIVSEAESWGAGLIVMGTEGDESVSNLFLGNNSNRVLHKSSIPVMTVRSLSPKVGYSKILLPIDFTAHSRQKVNAAFQVAKMFAAQVEAVGILFPSEKHSRYKMEVIINQVKKMAVKKNITFHSRIIISRNPAADILKRAAKSDSDLIITMTEERRSPLDFLKKSESTSLVKESKVPVLSLPAEVNEVELDSISIAGK